MSDERVLRPGDGRGAPGATRHPDHQPRVPMAAGQPPYCSCGYVGGNGINRPLLAEHLREHDPTYGDGKRDVLDAAEWTRYGQIGVAPRDGVSATALVTGRVRVTVTGDQQ